MSVYKVTSINKVDPTRYTEGDFFLTKQTIGMLHNGKIDRLVKQTDVRKIIRDEIKKVKKDD